MILVSMRWPNVINLDIRDGKVMCSCWCRTYVIVGGRFCNY